MCPVSEDMGSVVAIQLVYRVVGWLVEAPGGNPYYDNQLVNYGHLIYSLNFHRAKQGPPHQQTLSDQLQLHATCRAKVNKKRNKRHWRPDYLYQLSSPQVFINAEVFDHRMLSTQARG